jgi:hypothetical protein
MGNVLLVMGHRNTDGGDPREAQRTPGIVDAAARELRRAGHTVHILQEEDNSDQDPNFTHADLGVVATRCTQLIRQHGIDVMIDAHFQGSGNPTSGCFCIFPDGNHLSPQPPVDDSKAANQLDVSFASKLAEEVSRQTGIRRLPISEPGFTGGMSERQTGVASQGFRLGMFHLTVPVRERCVRVVMEHGDILADGSLIDSPGFNDRVAVAYVRAINQFWPVVPASEEFFAFDTPQEFTAHAGALGRKHASTASETLRQYDAGESIRCSGYYESQEVAGDRRWLRSTGPNSPRIHSSGVVEEIPVGVSTPPPPGDAPSNGHGRFTQSEEELARLEGRRRRSRAAQDPSERLTDADVAALGCDMTTSVAQAAALA